MSIFTIWNMTYNNYNGSNTWQILSYLLLSLLPHCVRSLLRVKQVKKNKHFIVQNNIITCLLHMKKISIFIKIIVHKKCITCQKDTHCVSIYWPYYDKSLRRYYDDSIMINQKYSSRTIIDYLQCKINMLFIQKIYFKPTL